MRSELGEKDAFARTDVEGLLSYIHVEVSFKNVEEFVLARVHMGRRLISGY
jgi:hypothetical protein